MKQPTITQKVLTSLKKVLEEQDEKGIIKYGVPLDSTYNYDWGRMADEEMADYLKYRECERQEKERTVRLLETAIKEQDFTLVHVALGLLRKSR